MPDPTLDYRSAPKSNAHKMARLMSFVTGSLYLLAALAIAIAMIVSAYLDRGGSSDFTLGNSIFYLFLFPCTLLPASMGLGFFWVGAGVTQGFVRRVKFGKYLALANFALLAAEGSVLVVGLIEDRPRGKDLLLVALICAMEVAFLATLVLTIWCLERSLRQTAADKEPVP